jgi:DNA end-binding protein Ku
MRTKQYLAALRPKDGALVLSTMVYADEVAPVEELSELAGLDRVTVSDRELTMATQLIESLAADFEPERYRDTYRDQVLELIERKAAGEDIVAQAPAPPDDSSVVDLMAALEASVADAREARKRHPTAAEAGTKGAAGGDGATAGGEEDGEKPKRKAPAKRAKKSA